MKRYLAIAALSMAVAPVAQAGVITTFANDLAGFTTAIGTASVTVEDFGPNTHFPISTGVLNSATNGVAGITAGLIQPGVTYSTPIGTGNFFNIDCCNASNGTPFLDTVTGNGPLTVSFDNATNAFGFQQLGFMGTVLHISINFSSGTPFSTDITLPGQNQFVGFVSSAADIASAVISGDNGTFTFAIDDFRFVSTPSTQVPEPTSTLLIALGLAGLGFARRKKA